MEASHWCAPRKTHHFNGAIALTRGSRRSTGFPQPRTSIDYNQAYGTTSQVRYPHREDQHLSRRCRTGYLLLAALFALADVAFDHNFSQSLDLQQAYGAGVGINLLKTPSSSSTSAATSTTRSRRSSRLTPPHNIIGSTFTETYLRNLPKKLVFNEFGSISPAWNQLNDYSAHANASLGFPIFKGLGFSLSGVDDYLNNAPAGSQPQLHTQFTTNLTYTIKPR